MGSATAKKLLGKIKEGLEEAGVPLRRLLMLGSDGPNVNKAVKRLLNEEVLSVRNKPLVDIGTCSIHTPHNAFLKGLDELGDDASDFIICTFNFLDGWPVRREEYNAIRDNEGLPKHQLLKHVSSRWLTMEPAANRALEQMPALRRYFLTHLRVKRPDLFRKQGCQKIVYYLGCSTLKAELLFVVASAKVFTRFTATFQKDEPLVHLLYTELKLLFKTLPLRVCKQSAWDKIGLNEKIFESSNLLDLKDIVWDADLSAELKTVPEKERLLFMKRAQKHYIAAAKHVLKKTPLSNQLVKSLRCLSPDARETERAKKDILIVAQALPADVRLDLLAVEWTLMQSEPGIEERSRIDEYWAQFYEKKHYNGDPKFPMLTKVVKMALSLSHGNATIERIFSTSADALTPDRASMKEETLNAIHMVKSGLKPYQNQVHLVPITKELLTLGRSAYSSHNLRLEAVKQKEEMAKRLTEEEKKRLENEEKARKMAEENKRLLKEDEDRLKELKEDLKEKQAASKTLYVEASERLRKATKAKNLAEVSVAQAMMEGVSVSQREVDKVFEEMTKLQRVVDKRRSAIIDTLSNTKKPKL